MIWVGTSGYNYPEWKGSFYPAKLPATKMLPFYAGEFSTVEINYSFYRLPSEKTLAGWVAATPETFRFSLKAPRRITHDARLRHCAELVDLFCGLARRLGPKLGILLFQLPPSFRKDLAVLDDFLGMLPLGTRAAFEFRHASWHDPEVFSRLRDRNLALCIADSERLSTPVEATANYGYLRLRDEGYGEEDIARWGRLIGDQRAWEEGFVYFKHEREGKGPEFAHLLRKALDGCPPASRVPRRHSRQGP